MSRMWVSPFVNVGESVVGNGVAVAEPDGRWQRAPIRYRTITFDELRKRSAQVAFGLQDHGVPVGARIALLVPPGIDFVIWVFGLLRAGAVVILIDPGIGKRNLIKCLSQSQPEGMVGVRRAHVARWLFRRQFPLCKHHFFVGRGWFPLARPTDPWFKQERGVWTCPTRSAEEPAAIIFTSGSTGPPKGVLYRHRHFLEQIQQIRDYFGIQMGDVDVSGFPLFALFNAAMGVTTVFPLMDATRPAKIRPSNFIDAVEQFRANQSFGSPALWNTVARFAETNRVKLSTLRRVLSAGAPVPPHVLQRVRNMIADDGEVFTPYGATEALPVACIESRIVLEETKALSVQGKGTCVGRAWPNIQWKIIAITDDPIPDLSDARVLPAEEIGELIVHGPVVTDQYVTRVEANALHKIRDGDRFWHRMGDVGYLDDQQRFWFCGRKSHRVELPDRIMFTIPCEAIINNHPAIYRCALVGVGQRGHQIAAIVAEPWPEHWPATRWHRQRLLNEIRELAGGHELTKPVAHFFLMRKLPVDIRHNAKIHREKIAQWVARRIGVSGNRKGKHD